MRRATILLVCGGLVLGACGAQRAPAATPAAPATPSAAAAPTAPPPPAPPPPAPAVPERPTPWIHMVDAQDGWAFTSGAVERTADGGRTWDDVTPPGDDPGVQADQHNPRTTDFLSATTAWIVGGRNDQYLYRTTDGGKEWTKLAIPSDIGDPSTGTVTDVVFADLSHGWLVVDLPAAMGTGHADIYRTEDGGKTWTLASRWTGGDPTGLGVQSAQTAWLGEFTAASGAAVTTETTDGGRRWRLVRLPVPAKYQDVSFGTLAPAFFSAQDGIMPALPNVSPPVMIFYVTRDGGRTWTPSAPVQSMDASQPLFSFIDAGHGWAVPGIGLLRTADGGKTWTPVNPQANDQLLWKSVDQIDFQSLTTGWIVRQRRLLQTTDGGRTWRTVHTWP